MSMSCMHTHKHTQQPTSCNNHVDHSNSLTNLSEKRYDSAHPRERDKQYVVTVTVERLWLLFKLFISLM